MQIITRGAWLWVIGFTLGMAVGAFWLAPKIASAQSVTPWYFGDSSAGTWDEYNLQTNLGSGDVFIGNRWHATSTDALSVCGFSSWWKKADADPTGSAIMYFGYLPEGHTTGTIGDVTVLAEARIAGNLITETEQKFDSYLKRSVDDEDTICLSVYPSLTWAIYYYVDTTDSKLITWTNDLGGDNHVQLSTETASGVEYYASGDLKMGMAQLITSEAPAVELPENCTYGIYCPLIAGVKWLFVPTQGITNIFDSVKDDLMTRVPFGYFATASSTIGEMDGTGIATTSTVISMTLNTDTVSGTVGIVDMQNIKSKVPSNIQTLIHTIGSMAVWAMFCFWIFVFATSHLPHEIRFKHFDDNNY